MAKSHPTAPVEGQKFSSCREARDFVNAHAQESGCALRPLERSTRCLLFYCEIRGNNGVECPYQVEISFKLNADMEDEWTVTRLCLDHNQHRSKANRESADSRQPPDQKPARASSSSTPTPVTAVAIPRASAKGRPATASPITVSARPRSITVGRAPPSAIEFNTPRKPLKPPVAQDLPSTTAPIRPSIHPTLAPAASPRSSKNVLVLGATFPSCDAADDAVRLAMEKRGYDLQKASKYKCSSGDRLTLCCKYASAPSDSPAAGVFCPCKISIASNPDTERWSIVQLCLDHNAECSDLYAGATTIEDIRYVARMQTLLNKPRTRAESGKTSQSRASTDPIVDEPHRKARPEDDSDISELASDDEDESEESDTESEGGLQMNRVFSNEESADKFIRAVMDKTGHKMSRNMQAPRRIYYRCKNYFTIPRDGGACRCHIYLEKDESSGRCKITDLMLRHTKQCDDVHKTSPKKAEARAGPTSTASSVEGPSPGKKRRMDPLATPASKSSIVEISDSDSDEELMLAKIKTEAPDQSGAGLYADGHAVVKHGMQTGRAVSSAQIATSARDQAPEVRNTPSLRDTLFSALPESVQEAFRRSGTPDDASLKASIKHRSRQSA